MGWMCWYEWGRWIEQDKYEPGPFNSHMNIVDLARSYIEPEAKRLKKEGKVAGDFRIRQALVVLPKNSPPVVSFNEGISWQMRMDTSQFAVGQAVYLHDIRKITGVSYPTLSGQKVAYIFMFYVGTGYNLIFDFSPNSSPQETIPEYGHAGDRALTSYYNLLFSEMSLNFTAPEKLSQLKDAGYFISPSIMPFPFSILADPHKDTQDFISSLLEHFNANTISAVIDKWRSLPAWDARFPLFHEAVENYREGRWASVISILTPQMEGVLRDVLHSLTGDDSYMNAQNALKDIYAKLDEESLPAFTMRLLDSFNEFFNDTSGLFVSFKRWTDAVEGSYLSRHVVSHGKHLPSMYTKENSIRLFLILDTIFEISSVLHGSETTIKQ